MADNSQLLAERKKRYFDCVELKKPDRVPIAPLAEFFPARLKNYTVKEVMYNHDLMSEAWLYYHEKYQPDQSQNPFRLRGFGPLLETLDFQHLKWAGHGLPDNMAYQFVELELLKVEEYDHFINDMSDFMLRRYIPRVCKSLAAFEKLPPFSAQFSYFWGLFWPTAFLDPEVAKAVESVREAALAGAKLLAAGRELEGKYQAAGFPPSSGGYTQAPFDTLSDVLRGTKGLMLDMRRCPDKIMAACEKILPLMINAALGAAKASGCPITFIPLHKCMDTFMSQAQFEKFYWPHFQELLQELCRNGLYPWVLVEGNCDNRLNSFRNVPEGKIVWHIEGSNLRKAKEAFRGVSCIRGNLPVSVLVMGSPDDVRAECKKILDLMKDDGGFIFDTGVNIGDARFENVDAMFDYVREHGVY
ncbi:MAG: hypothetical protein LBE31_03740 [Deltaproteobacteria bacterium]|jgi:uroporphyrinogen-III decarboxylase|nr:hypothetical protein [Deltaproteobacteria bacterium]